MNKPSLWRKRQIIQTQEAITLVADLILAFIIAVVSIATFSLVYVVLRYLPLSEHYAFWCAFFWSLYPVGVSVWRQWFSRF